jgi:acyl-CoA thioesterase-1
MNLNLREKPISRLARLLAILLACALATSTRAAEVVAIGDSTTEDNYKTTPAYPTLMAASAPQWNIIDEGVSGDTSAGGLARIGSIIAMHPQVVVIQYGGGDSFWEVGATGPYVTVPDFVSNLTAMVDDLRAAGIKPVLLTPDPFLQAPSNVNYGPYATVTPNDLVQQYAAAVRALAPQLQVPMVDAYQALAAAVGDLNVPSDPHYYDYRHPTTQGEAVVAAALQPVVASLVPEPSAIALAATALVPLWLLARRKRRTR